MSTHAACTLQMWDRVITGIPDETVPLGLDKCRRYGVRNVILEMDVMAVMVRCMACGGKMKVTVTFKYVAAFGWGHNSVMQLCGSGLRSDRCQYRAS